MRVLIVCFLVLPLLMQGQSRFRAGIKAGLAATQVDGDTYTGFNKAGLSAGGFVNGRLSEKFSAAFEILYIQKGSRHIGKPEENDYRYYLMKLQYVEVPVLLQFHHKHFTFEAGPGLGYLFDAREYDVLGEVFNPVPFSKGELSGHAGLSYTLFKRFAINWRYSYSLMPIRINRDPTVAVINDRGQRNNLLQFTVHFTFGKPDE